MVLKYWLSEQKDPFNSLKFLFDQKKYFPQKLAKSSTLLTRNKNLFFSQSNVQVNSLQQKQSKVEWTCQWMLGKVCGEKTTLALVGYLKWI